MLKELKKEYMEQQQQHKTIYSLPQQERQIYYNMHYKLLKELNKEELIIFNTCFLNRIKEDNPKIYKQLVNDLFSIVKGRIKTK